MSSGGMGSDVRNLELACVEFVGSGSLSHAKPLRFRRKTRGKRFGGMGSDVQNSELAIGESLDNG
jgi:hypothetical protein